MSLAESQYKANRQNPMYSYVLELKSQKPQF